MSSSGNLQWCPNASPDAVDNPPQECESSSEIRQGRILVSPGCSLAPDWTDCRGTVQNEAPARHLRYTSCTSPPPRDRSAGPRYELGSMPMDVRRLPLTRKAARSCILDGRTTAGQRTRAVGRGRIGMDATISPRPGVLMADLPLLDTWNNTASKPKELPLCRRRRALHPTVTARTRGQITPLLILLVSAPKTAYSDIARHLPASITDIRIAQQSWTIRRASTTPASTPPPSSSSVGRSVIIRKVSVGQQSTLPSNMVWSRAMLG